MITDNNGVSDPNVNGGAGDDSANVNDNDGASGAIDGDGNVNDSGDTVSFETHKRAKNDLFKWKDRARNAEQRLKEFEDQKKSADAAKLEEQGEYKKLLENERKENAELAKRLSNFTAHQVEAKKIGALVDALNGQVPKKYWHFLDTDDIVIDPDSGDIDKMSLQKAADSVRQNFPEIIRSGRNGSGTPTESPNGNGGTLTRDEWQKLPVEEMKKRLPELRENEKSAGLRQ